MSQRTHLWLLVRGEPSAVSETRAWLRALLQHRPWAGAAMPWYLPLLGGLLATLWGRRLLAVPSGELGLAAVAARKLGQTLGEDWVLRPVALFGSSDARAASAGVADGDTALLLSLLPQHSAARDAQIAAATSALASRRLRLVILDPLGERAGFVEAIAESVRATLADLPPNANYALIFYAPALADGHRGSVAEEVKRCGEAVVAALGLRQPHYLGWVQGPGAWAKRAPDLHQAARAAIADGATHIVMAPLAQILDWLDVDRAIADLMNRYPAVKWVKTDPAMTRPTLLREIADTVTDSRNQLHAARARPTS